MTIDSLQKDVMIADASEDAGRPALKILVLDDDPADRLRMTRLVQKTGLKASIAEASNLAELHKRMDEGAFDFIFIDQHLGLESGLDALSMVVTHADQADAIPIMVTSVNTPCVIVEAMRTGSADYLIKDELSVDAMRKSIVAAFERRILIAAASETRQMHAQMRRALRRFATACGTDMREIVAAALRRSRNIRLAVGDDRIGSADFQEFEKSCGKLSEFLGEVDRIFNQRMGPDGSGNTPQLT